MLFPLVTIGGIECRLCLLEPNGGSPFELTYALGTAVGTGLTGVDERQPLVGAPRLSSYQADFALEGGEADEWRVGMAALLTRPIAIPLWVDCLAVSRWDERIHDAGYLLNWDDADGAYTIYAAADLPAELAHPWLAPLAIGIPRKNPKHIALHGQAIALTLDWEEAAPYSHRISPRGTAGGWTFSPDWVGEISETIDGDPDATWLGHAREPIYQRPHFAPRWRQEASFVFESRAEIRQALGHWLDRLGSYKAWDGLPPFLSTGPATDYTPAALRARFATDKLQLTFEGDGSTQDGLLATATVAFLQEVAVVEGVTQEAPPLLRLFTLRYEAPGWAADARCVERWCQYDQPITAGGAEYEARPSATGALKLDLKPTEERCECEVDFRLGSLLSDHHLRRLYYPLFLEVHMWSPATPEVAPHLRFRGRVSQAAPTGQRVKVTALALAAVLRRQMPRWKFQRACNHIVFDAGCGLAEAAWKCTGVIADAAAISAGGRTVVISGGAGPRGPGWTAEYFAGGILRWGQGRDAAQVEVRSSSAVAGGVQLVLTRPVFAAALTLPQAVEMLPGCDGQRTTCTGFGNTRYSGLPHIPAYIDETPADNSGAGAK